MNTTGFFETVELIFHDWHYDHPRILYALIRAMKPQVVMEVGTYRGYAACYMARAIQENNAGRLYCIDNFSETTQRNFADPVAHWNGNLEACGVRDWVTLIRGDSDKVQWPHKIDFAYIDGWHSYQMCQHDFFQASVAGATCICLDDTTQSVGPRMVSESFLEGWDVLDFHHDCGLTICNRRQPKPPFTFSQELPGHPGTDLRFMDAAQRKTHFDEAAKTTGLDYSEFCK